MKAINWLCWLLFVCVCLTEARYKFRRPPMPPPPPPSKLLFKKSWPSSHRISMGNQIHIGANFPPKRMHHKPPNYRIRRPPLFNVLPNVWKNQIPMRAPLNNHAVLPQRPPVKEFHSVNKMPEYSPEYRPEVTVLPPTHRGGLDDDKGPIHTIPAPNLSPMDRPYNSEINSEEATHQRQYASGTDYKPNLHPGTLLPNVDLATIGTSIAPQRTVTSPTPMQHQYEVTESNDINQKEYQTVLPTFLPSEFDVTRLSTLVNPDLQTNEVFLNQPVSNIGLLGPNLQFGQTGTPMQTKLHSSLHVGFPGTAGPSPYMINQQIPDLHVGHPAPAGPPLSATQLYELLNSFPQKLTEQYQSGQQPQLQQHILQQQLGQFFQPAGMTGFSQPQMHSFNYNEQDNKEQQQQHILLGQEYLAGRVNTDYNVGAEQSIDAESNENLPQNDEIAYVSDGTEQLENNIEYEETNSKGQSTYFNKVSNNGDLSTKFYTTLPSREAAERLAALAAAGNVNSHLLEQIRKRQRETLQNDETLPPNHKDEDYETDQQSDADRYKDEQAFQQEEQYRTDDQPQQYDPRDQEQQYTDQQKYDRQQIRQQHHQRQNHYVRNDKRPLRIMVPDEDTYTSGNDRSNGGENENIDVEYEYENDDGEIANSQSNPPYDSRTSYEQPTAEFGTRLNTKTGK